MTSVPVGEQLSEAASLLDFATNLGKVCLAKAQRMVDLEETKSVSPFAKELEATVAAIDHEPWLRARTEGDLAPLLQVAGLGDKIAFTEANSPIEYLAVLRGLLGALRRFYDEVEGKVLLEAGIPVPLATRRVNDRIGDVTPRLETLRLNDLLEGSGFYLFDPGIDDRTPVVLDFSHRDRLDELTWTANERLPRIATLHPFLGHDGLEIGEVGTRSFFGVRPRSWNAESVVEQLKAVASEVEIAVLPELSLRAVDALEDVLAADPGSFPPIVIAGSAHLTESDGSATAVRANESRIYLDGIQVGAHRKIHPFLLKELPGMALPETLREGITRERKALTLLAGDRTRLAVAICADVIDSKLPRLLEEAGVNLLLVPALTAGPGSFNGSICGVASQCQGVSVVVNGDGVALVEEGGELPFMVMAGVPRAAAGEQSAEWHRPNGSNGPFTGILDPNLPLAQAFEWH
jgi:hypothetical protein